MKMILVPDKWVLPDGNVRVLVGSRIHHRKIKTPRVRVEVFRGVADVTRCTPGVTVTITDHDNEQVGL